MMSLNYLTKLIRSVSVSSKKNGHVLLFNSSRFMRPLGTQSNQTSQDNNNNVEKDLNNRVKLMYKGSLKNKIKLLKAVSLITSTTIAGSYVYVITIRGITTTIAATSLIFTPFVASPVLIWWIFKRYVTRLTFDPQTGQYTLHHCGIFLGENRITFKKTNVIRCPGTEVLNTFKVNDQPFFLNEEDLEDPESVQQYKIMIGLD